MSILRPHPVLDVVGDLGTPRAVPVPSPSGPSRSLLTDLFPTFQSINCGFEALTVLDGTAAPASGISAWYGLAKFDIAQFGQDVWLDYVGVQLGPTEPNATGNNLVWGTSAGAGAAIVVGRNLPTLLDAWTTAQCYVPGVEAAAAGNVIANGPSPYDAVFSFPTGTYQDTAPNKPFLPLPFGKVVKRYRVGEIFDVALVVRGSQVAASGANKTLRGHVLVNVRLGLTQTIEGFNS